jgi:hypothetical protein
MLLLCFLQYSTVSDVSTDVHVSIFRVKQSSTILLGPLDPEYEDTDASKRR